MALKCVFRLFCESNCSSRSVCGAAFRLVNHFVLWECELSICHNQCVWIIKPELWLIRLYMPIFYRFAPLVVIEDLIIRCSHLLWLSFHLVGLYGRPESRTRRDYSVTQLCLFFPVTCPFSAGISVPITHFYILVLKCAKPNEKLTEFRTLSICFVYGQHRQYFCIVSMNIQKTIIFFLFMYACMYFYQLFTLNKVYIFIWADES